MSMAFVRAGPRTLLKMNGINSSQKADDVIEVH